MAKVVVREVVRTKQTRHKIDSYLLMTTSTWRLQHDGIVMTFLPITIRDITFGQSPCHAWYRQFEWDGNVIRINHVDVSEAHISTFAK